MDSQAYAPSLAHDAGRSVLRGQHGARSDSRETVSYIAPLVLSLFPGIGLLDRAFELAGFCVVRGPDLIWGGDVRTFHPPPEMFAGVIGGPPCQIHSRLRHLNPLAGQKHGDMIPEFARCAYEAQPKWWLMEEVPEAPIPVVRGYQTHSQIVNNRWVGGVQHRQRRFTFGTRDGRKLHIEYVALESADFSQAVTSSSSIVPVALGGSGKPKRKHARSGPACGPRLKVADMLRLQGLPETYLDECPLTAEGKQQAVGNGVPLPLGTALAKAVRITMREHSCSSTGSASFGLRSHVGSGTRRGLVGVGGVFFGLPPFAPFARAASALASEVARPPRRPRVCAALFIVGLLLLQLCALDCEARGKVAVVVFGVAVVLAEAKSLFRDVHSVVVELVFGEFGVHARKLTLPLGFVNELFSEIFRARISPWAAGVRSW